MVIAEIMKSSRKISFLLLIAMGLALLPAPPDTANDMTPHADIDSCDTIAADTCDDADCCSEPGSGDDNCCDSDCQHCSLPCCSGTAMIADVAQMLDAALTLDGRLVATATDLTWFDADQLYHPPRG